MTGGYYDTETVLFTNLYDNFELAGKTHIEEINQRNANVDQGMQRLVL